MNDMSSTPEPSKPARAPAGVDFKLEVVVIPVSDIDRAKDFYAKLGWRLDGDFVFEDTFRGVQFTPPGSPCSIQFGKGSAATPYLVVSDIAAARAELITRGVEVSEIFHINSIGGPPMSGRHPAGGSYASFATFKDPDGNGWLLQEVTTRLPGRVEGSDATYTSAADLKDALWRAALAHGEHEARNGGVRDENWPDWYAAYMLAERTGRPLPI